ASGSLPIPCSPTALTSIIGSAEHREKVRTALSSFATMGISAAACAEWIRSIEAAESRAPRPDIVWSGPEVPGVHARDTRRVFDELVGSSQSSVWLSTFVFFDGSKAFEALAKKLDTVPSLQVTLLLNIQRGRGDTSAATELVRRFADR